jgi:hypothetical protein
MLLLSFRVFTHKLYELSANFVSRGEICVQYLPRLVHLALQSCNLEDGTAFELADSDGDDNLGGAIGGLSSDEDEDTDHKRVRNFSVRTGVLDEKAAAAQALGLFALHTKSAFMPYPFLSCLGV